MYKSKENTIVCCRKSAFLKDNLAKKGANIRKISAFVLIVKRNLLCIEDLELVWEYNLI